MTLKKPSASDDSVMTKIITVDDLKETDKKTVLAKIIKPVGTAQARRPIRAYKPAVDDNRLKIDGRIIPDADVPTQYRQGVLNIMPEGHGFLRPTFIHSKDDIYISSSQIRRFRLRKGDFIGGQVRKPKQNERYFGLLKVEKVNDVAIEKVDDREWFDKLSPIYPQPQIKTETAKEILTTRMLDLIAPIGFGQRGMIVSPPKAGKTWLLKDIAAGVSANHPDIHLMAVLIAERPEEVTDIRRGTKGEVVASNFDESPIHQIRTAEIALERAKRLVEMGKNVFIILDSITRLARAYNLAVPSSGRSMSGGFDSAALYPAKQFLGAARNIEDGGSLTIIGTALVDTGSRMDELIYEEFKGTGNMELHLSRDLAEKRIFPAFDIQKSGTRKEELLFGEEKMKAVSRMRRMISLLGNDERTEAFTNQLEKSETNDDFLEMISEKAGSVS